MSHASRNFSKLLREVRRGASFVITSRGQPVALVEPMRAVRAGLMIRLQSQPTMDIGKWTRDELYD